MPVEKFLSVKTLGNPAFIVVFMLFMVVFIMDFFIGKAIWRDEAEKRSRQSASNCKRAWAIVTQ